MSSDYKGKDVFGADTYQGSDGLYNTQADADRTWRSDYKQDDDEVQPGTYTQPAQSPNPFATQGPVYAGGNTGLSPVNKNRWGGIILCLVGSSLINWGMMAFQQEYQAPGLIFRLLSLLSLIVLWPGRLVFGLMADRDILSFTFLVPIADLMSFVWLCIVGKVLLKQGKFKTLLGLQLKEYKQLSWIKVAFILLAVHLLVALSFKL